MQRTHCTSMQAAWATQDIFIQRVPVLIPAGYAEALWNEKFVQHFYVWPAVGIEAKTFWF